MAADIQITSGPGVAPGLLSVVGRLINVAVSPGLVALGTKDVVVSAPGVVVGDTILVSLSSGATLSVGVVMSGATATATDQITIRFVCPIIAGVTLGSFNINIAWLR